MCAKYRFAFLIYLTLASAMGCGSSGGEGKKNNSFQPISVSGTQSAYQQGTNFCNAQFISHYNEVIRAFKSAARPSDLDKIENLIDEFQGRYRDVICQADVRDENDLDAEVSSIDVNERTLEWKNAIIKAKRTLPPPEARNDVG